MALEKFKAAPLPNPPATYDPQYVRQLIRVIEIYFSQLDSFTPNQAQSYRADNFYGGAFTGTNFTATNVTSVNTTTTNLTAAYGEVGYLDADRVDALYADIDAIHGHRAEVTTIMGDNFYGGTFYGDGRFLNTPYNQFQSVVDQTATNVATAMALQLEVTDFADGIYISGGSNTRITFRKAGVYKLTYSLSFKNTTNDAQTIDIWFRYNGTDVANSNSRFSVPARKSTGDPSYLIAVTPYIGIATADDVYVEIMWRVSDVNVTLEYLPAVTASPGVTPAIPATPSALVQAEFVSAEYPPKTRVAPLPVIGFGQIGNVSVSIS